MERELARAKISANRVASVVANDWKDENDKVMPVKQWLEERRFLQVSILSFFSLNDASAKGIVIVLEWSSSYYIIFMLEETHSLI